MEEKEKVCQICNEKLKSEEYYNENFKDCNITNFMPSHWQGICSYKCQEEALAFNAGWKLKTRLKNMSHMPFSSFQEAFKMPEAGGYAEEKYQKMRAAPHLFIQMLDIENFKKLMRIKV